MPRHFFICVFIASTLGCGPTSRIQLCDYASCAGSSNFENGLQALTLVVAILNLVFLFFVFTRQIRDRKSDRLLAISDRSQQAAREVKAFWIQTLILEDGLKQIDKYFEDIRNQVKQFPGSPDAATVLKATNYLREMTTFLMSAQVDKFLAVGEGPLYRRLSDILDSVRDLASDYFIGSNLDKVALDQKLIEAKREFLSLIFKFQSESVVT